MARNGGRWFGEGMAQDPRIQPLTDDLAILVRRENHSIAGATANRGDGGQLKALGVASARRARPHRGGLSAAGEIRDCPEGPSGMLQAACPVLAPFCRANRAEQCRLSGVNRTDVFIMVRSDRDRQNGLKRSALNRMALLATLRNSTAIGSALADAPPRHGRTPCTMK